MTREQVETEMAQYRTIFTVVRLLDAAQVGGEEGVTEDAAERVTPSRRTRRVSTTDPGVVVVGTDDGWVKLARCCTPVPGDEIIGVMKGVQPTRKDEDEKKPALPMSSVPISPTGVTA